MVYVTHAIPYKNLSTENASANKTTQEIPADNASLHASIQCTSQTAIVSPANSTNTTTKKVRFASANKTTC